MEVDEGPDQKSDMYWMAAHARLKNEFMEDKKYHNLMSWRICSSGTGFKHPAFNVKIKLFNQKTYK